MITVGEQNANKNCENEDNPMEDLLGEMQTIFHE